MYFYCTLQGLATKLFVDKQQIWKIPDEWPLEQSSVIPLAYSTAYYSLIIRGHVHCGQSVLIHGNDGVGHAATRVALHHGCEVYITTPSLKDLPELLLKFNQLKKGNVLQLDKDFQNELLRKTKGIGTVKFLSFCIPGPFVHN